MYYSSAEYFMYEKNSNEQFINILITFHVVSSALASACCFCFRFISLFRFCCFNFAMKSINRSAPSTTIIPGIEIHRATAAHRPNNRTCVECKCIGANTQLQWSNDWCDSMTCHELDTLFVFFFFIGSLCACVCVLCPFRQRKLSFIGNLQNEGANKNNNNDDDGGKKWSHFH